MTSKNDITGDEIKSKANSDACRNSPFWDSLKKHDNSTEDENPTVTLAMMNLEEAVKRYKVVYEELYGEPVPPLYLFDGKVKLEIL